MEEDILFDIDFLISPLIEQRLSGLSSLQEKIDILFVLLDYSYSDLFTDEEKIDIEHFYAESTGSMQPASVTLTKDEKDFILNEYAVCFPDFDGIKHLISEICNSETKEKAIDDAVLRIEEEHDRRNRAAAEKRKKIFDSLSFNEDNSKDSSVESSADSTAKSPVSEPMRRRKLNTIFQQNKRFMESGNNQSKSGQ